METEKSKNTKSVVYVLIATIAGVVVGLLYLCFEWFVTNGTQWLWNDVVQSDIYRWRVIPLAVIMSVVLTFVIKIPGKKRITDPPLGLLDELNDIKKTTLGAIATILIIGALSLLAGASLGPEASLVAASLGVATWLSGKINALKQPYAFALNIASIGALLAAFFNSLLPVAIPLLILKKKGKLNPISAIVVIVAGVASWFLVRVIKNEAYIEIPVTGTFNITNFVLALVLGLLSIVIALALKWAIHIIYPFATKIDRKIYWILGAITYGLVLGVLYFIGGETVQFSGSEGLKLLSHNPAQYGAAALLGMIIVKLLATSWSTTAGYRGGLVFPSIYMGVVLSFLVSTLFGLTGNAEVGTTIGSITGVLIGMTNPIVGIVLAFALFPLSQFAVVIGAVIGSLIGLKLTANLIPQVSKSK